MNEHPVPTKLDTLNRLINKKIPISCVVDIGVNEHTHELIQCFGHLKHYLFEPVSLYFNEISKNYMEIDYELYPIALSDENSEVYLVLKSIHKDGIVTHSWISNDPVSVDGSEIVGCERVEVKRFVDLPLSNIISHNFLLKVDVDGKDLNVVKGFGEKISVASVIIIECTYNNLLERMDFIRNSGFTLFDIVDITYYGPSIYQFDMVFVRNDLLTSELRPPIQNFRRDFWHTLCF